MIIKNGKTISSIYKGNQVIEKIYKGTLVVYESFKNLIASGVPPLTLLNCGGKDLVDYKLYGNSVQDGTPTPETPIKVESVGEYDETTGKYKIPVKVSNGTEEITTNIYLNEPLRKIDNFADYIDFENKKVVRNIASVNVTKINSMSAVTSYDYCAFLINISKKPYITGSAGSSIGFAISNKFKQSKVIYNRLYDYPGLIQSYITSSGGNRLACTFTDTTIRTVTKAQEAIGDGFEACFVLATPIEETIELPNIPTIKGTTILEVDTEIQPSNLKVVYEGKEVK